MYVARLAGPLHGIYLVTNSEPKMLISQIQMFSILSWTSRFILNAGPCLTTHENAWRLCLDIDEAVSQATPIGKPEVLFQARFKPIVIMILIMLFSRNQFLAVTLLRLEN